MKRNVRIVHRGSGLVLADGPIGWGVTPFEGNYYIGSRYLKCGVFTPSLIPGFCFYKGLYVWMDLEVGGGTRERGLGWLYWLPNPLMPFIWFRVGVSRADPALIFEEYTA